MTEILLALILGLLLLFILGVIIVFSIAFIPDILDATSEAKKAIDEYKRGDYE